MCNDSVLSWAGSSPSSPSPPPRSKSAYAACGLDWSTEYGIPLDMQSPPNLADSLPPQPPLAPAGQPLPVGDACSGVRPTTLRTAGSVLQSDTCLDPNATTCPEVCAQALNAVRSRSGGGRGLCGGRDPAHHLAACLPACLPRTLRPPRLACLHRCCLPPPCLSPLAPAQLGFPCTVQLAQKSDPNITPQMMQEVFAACDVPVGGAPAPGAAPLLPGGAPDSAPAPGAAAPPQQQPAGGGGAPAEAPPEFVPTGCPTGQYANDTLAGELGTCVVEAQGAKSKCPQGCDATLAQVRALARVGGRAGGHASAWRAGPPSLHVRAPLHPHPLIIEWLQVLKGHPP